MEKINLSYTLRSFLVFTSLFLISCGDSPTGSSSTASPASESVVAFKLASDVIATIFDIEVTVSGSDMETVREKLEISGNTATGTVSVRAGSNRVFTINAYNDSRELLYVGQTWVDIIEGDRAVVDISLRSVSPEEPQSWMSGSINELAYISFYSSSENWDADAEDDGLEFSPTYYDSSDDYIRGFDNATVKYTVQIFIGEEKVNGDVVKKYEIPFVEKSAYLSDRRTNIKIGYDEFGNYADDDTDELWNGNIVVPVVEELTIYLATGHVYQARNNTSYRAW